MRNLFAKTFFEEAKINNKLTMTVADISPAGAMNEFRTAFPERFINTGVAEQAMIGICAGLAMGGFHPFAYTIGTFSAFRPFEFIRNDVCYQDLPVTIVGIGGGVVYSTLGSTHHAQEDVAVMKALPNMQVYAPCDPQETEAVTRFRCSNPVGPAYVRLGKAGERNIGSMSNFSIDQPRQLRKGKEICVVGYGPILEMADQTLAHLASLGRDYSLYSFMQLKPFNSAGCLELIQRYQGIIVLEEMSPYNGLYHDFLDQKEKAKLDTLILQLCLKDKFIHRYGSHEDILESHGLTPDVLIKKIDEAAKI